MNNIKPRAVTARYMPPQIDTGAIDFFRLACPPWAIGFKRSHWSGICQIPSAWRDYLFASPGGVWQDYRAPARPNQPPSLRLTALTMIASKELERIWEGMQNMAQNAQNLPQK